MIKINDILKVVNEGFKTHYYKDITTYEVAELVTREDIEGNEITVPALYVGDGQYQYLQDDTKGLIIYHRIINFANDEDTDLGFGRNSLNIENYEIKTVFYGQQPSIEKDCEDINYYLAKEFKKLVIRKLNVSGQHRTSITVSNIDYDKTSIKDAEGLEIVPESVLFTLTLNLKINVLESCEDLGCDYVPYKSSVTITDNENVNSPIEVVSGGEYTCLPAPTEVSEFFELVIDTRISGANK